MASTATDDAGAHSAPGEDKRTDAASSSTANKNSTTLPPQSDAQAQLKAALEVERNLRDIIIALAAVLQLRRQSYNAGTGGRGGPNGAGAGAGQGGSEQAASIVPLPSPYPRPAAFQSRPVGVHGARIGGAGIASSSNVGAQNGNGPNGLNAASNVHAVGGVDGRGARAGAAFAREGVDLVMSAHVRRLASLCQSFLGKTNRLRDWLIQVITAVDNELEVQFKLAPAPSPPALTAAELVEAITSSAPLLMDSPVVAVPTSSTAMQTSSPVASIGTGAVVTPAPAREIIDLAADDDDDELPLGQLRDRSKPSPSKPSASGTSGGRADHAGEGAGTPSSISTPGAAAAMASKKRKRTSSASVGADMPSSLSSKMPMPARDDIVDLTMDSPSPSPATPSASSKKTPKLGADAVKTAGGGASVEAVPSSTSPGGSSVLFAGGGVGDTPASLSGLGEAVTSSAPAPVDASLPASTATAATTTTTAPTSTTAAPGGDLFSMTQPELDLSALLAADEGAGGAKGGDDGKTGSAASGEGAKGGAASSTLPVSCSASTTAVTATAPAPTSTATEASTTSTTTTTSNPLLPGLSFDFGTASSGAGLDMSAYLDASQYMNLDSDAMAALDSMDFSGIDFGSFGTGEGDAGGDGLGGGGDGTGDGSGGGNMFKDLLG